MKDQQEAERKKVTSQEIQEAVIEQTKGIKEKQADVREDLAQVEPAVIEAQQGKLFTIRSCIRIYQIELVDQTIWSHSLKKVIRDSIYYYVYMKNLSIR